MKKKILVFLLVFALCLPLLVACGNDEEAETLTSDTEAEEIVVDRTAATAVYSLIGLERGIVGVTKNAEGRPLAVKVFDFEFYPNFEYSSLFELSYDTKGRVSSIIIKDTSLIVLDSNYNSRCYELKVNAWDEENRPLATEVNFGVTASLEYTNGNVTITFKHTELLTTYALTFDSIGRVIAVNTPRYKSTLTMDGNVGKFVDTPDDGYANLYYDDNGSMNKLEFYERDGEDAYVPNSTFTFTFDSAAHCIETRESYFYTEGEKTYSHEYRYAYEYTGDNCTKLSGYTIEDGQETCDEIYYITYNDKGLSTERKSVSLEENGAETVEYTDTFEYDANGRITKNVSTSWRDQNNKSNVNEIVCEYNAEGFLIKHEYTGTYYDEQGNAKQTTKNSYEYSYNANGLLAEVNCVETEHDGTQTVSKQICDYQKTTDGYTRTVSMFRDDVICAKNVSEYGSNGIIKKETVIYYAADGTETDRSETLYDEYGDRIRNDK